jgi:hypothetical protein
MYGYDYLILQREIPYKKPQGTKNIKKGGA